MELEAPACRECVVGTDEVVVVELEAEHLEIPGRFRVRIVGGNDDREPATETDQDRQGECANGRATPCPSCSPGISASHGPPPRSDWRGSQRSLRNFTR